MKNWAILFVKTGAEEKLAGTLAECFEAMGFFPFVPTRVVSIRSKGTYSKIQKPLFPGYIFVQTEIDVEHLAEKLRAALTSVPYRGDTYSILHYGDNKNNVVVRKKERLYWERLFNAKFCVEDSSGFIVGDVIRVTSGPLVGMESKIKKINRHNREAIVEVDFMGDVRTVKLMLNIVEKNNV